MARLILPIERFVTHNESLPLTPDRLSNMSLRYYVWPTIEVWTIHCVDPYQVIPAMLFQKRVAVPASFRQPHRPAASLCHDLINHLLG